MPQVRFIARRIHDRLPASVVLGDLVNAGVIGLIDALAKYDPKKNVELRSYAKFRIRGAILDSLRELDWSPRDLRRKARRIEEADCRFAAERGRSATEPELAVEMGMDLAEFYRLLRDLRGLQQSRSSTETDTVEEVAAAAEDDPFHSCERGEMKRLLARSMGELHGKERQVLALYYFEERTMREIGARLGVGESRVSQIHSAALARMKAHVEGLLRGRPKIRRQAA